MDNITLSGKLACGEKYRLEVTAEGVGSMMILTHPKPTLLTVNSFVEVWAYAHTDIETLKLIAQASKS